ncbi:enoyl-CoA hydratase [Streptomyces sp. CB01201]|uniref:enoyl-CoA hydratase-related protein n=1 Tax=unclassified Streptomyces TaxID=2593676 RepID=UPI000C27B66D|nr:enoyl-CoA hydratase-related protein [Streptomyces sp. CB01201]PJN02049.1 enoyl-CoA hydratase [Streptomyces sp. CB01201]
MTYSAIEVTRTGAVLRVTLARPDRGNTVDATLLADLDRALDEAESAAECRIVVLDARGSVFCNGLDMVEAAAPAPGGPDGASLNGTAFFRLLRRFTQLSRTIVANVDGRVAGGGVGLVAACDLVHATERSTFSLPEALWGLLPCSVLPYLIRRTGFQTAYAMTLTTLPLTAAEAVERRLADEVSPDADPLVRRLVSRLTKVDGHVIGDAKRYFSSLHPITEQTERHAVDEFARLASAPGVRDGFARFAAAGRYPWEK